MKFLKTGLIIMALSAFLSCSGGGGSSDGDASAKEISGTTSVSANVVIGAFSADYWFNNDYFGEEDVVVSEFDTPVTPAEFSPLKWTTPDNSGAYLLALPADPTTMGEVIAWVDTDSDGKFDLGTESGYFPVKNIEGTDYVIDSFGWIDLSAMGYDVYYLVSYGSGNNDGFDIVGTTGFNFTID